MESRSKISVAVITYNQESTIAQTLESILCQEGDFDLEVVVGEDHSTDSTREKCLAFSDSIRLLADEPNLGIMGNFARVMKQCTGDYVAICAGDDYWCDNHKLEKQLAFLNAHPDYGVVTTNGYKLIVRKNKLVPGISPLNPIKDGNVKQYYFSNDYKGGVYAMPLSMMFRSEMLKYIDFDEYIARKFPVEDYPMQAVLSQHTKFGHVDDYTCVYRVYNTSATFISFDHPRYMAYHRGLVDIRHYLDELFPEDRCLSEEELDDYLFYKEFLLYLHRKDYSVARKLVESCSNNTGVKNQAKRFTQNRITFYAFHYYKELIYAKDRKARA